jgi:uncharacterized protein YhbP (UPF0306 family)
MVSKQELKKHVSNYLAQNRVMSLATSKGGVPWASTVMFAYDADLNLYFLSKEETRKAQNLQANPQVSVTINQFQKTPGKILGIQLEGTAKKLDKTKNVHELELFKKRFDWAKDFLHDHELFQITPKKIYYLDDEKFGPQGREELVL